MPSPCSPGARPPRTRPPCTAPAWASRLSHVKVLARSSRARRAAWRAFHVKVLPCSSRARGPAWRACQSPGCACPSLSTWETRVAQTVHGWGLQNCCFSLPPAHAACRGSYTGSEGGGEEEEGATSDEGDLAELGEMNDEALARHLQQREDRAHYRRLLELAGVGARGSSTLAGLWQGRVRLFVFGGIDQEDRRRRACGGNKGVTARLCSTCSSSRSFMSGAPRAQWHECRPGWRLPGPHRT